MLNGCTVDNVVIGGPAYGKMTRGDTIKSVDGQKATSSNIAALLFGSDLPGSEVKVEVQGSKGIKKVVLRRMKVQAITDKVHMFHLFTEVKKAASVHKDTNMDKLVDQSIDHWTKMQIAEAEHDHRVCENVEAMQHLAQSTLAALTKELASMRGYSEVLFGCIKDRRAQDKAQAENADLHNQVEALWSENDALKKQLAALQQQRAVFPWRGSICRFTRAPQRPLGCLMPAVDCRLRSGCLCRCLGNGLPWPNCSAHSRSCYSGRTRPDVVWHRWACSNSGPVQAGLQRTKQVQPRS